jgi:fibrillarin-like pre-rRNA processing protein
MKEVWHNVFREGDKLYTTNLDPGQRVYGEPLTTFKGAELRGWNPTRSKLAAAILNGLKTFPFEANSHVLYLGAAQGTTPSHVSDVCDEGVVVCVDVSQKTMESLIPLSERRENMLPVLGDANNPGEYAEYCEGISIIYQDVAQPNQAAILLKNAELLKKGHLFLTIKARSVDVTKRPADVIAGEVKQLEKELDVLEVIRLEPYEQDHAMVVCKK